MFAFEQAPFYDSDEKAHLGYAHEIADFRLPEIERQPAVPDSATQWQVERATGRDGRYRGVWVANHPPLHYVAVAPLIWFAEATDRPDGGLLLMRFANIALRRRRCRVHVPAGDRAGRRQAPRRPRRGGDRRPRARRGTRTSPAASTTGWRSPPAPALLWAGVRCLRRADRRNLVVLGATAAVAAGTRTATMLLAVVVVGAVAARSSRADPGEPWRRRVRGAAIDRGRRPRSGRRAVRVVLRPHPAALRRRRSVDVPARLLRSRAAGEHRPHLDARVGCGRTSTTG